MVSTRLTQMFFDSQDLHVLVLRQTDGMYGLLELARHLKRCWQIPLQQFQAAHL